MAPSWAQRRLLCGDGRRPAARSARHLHVTQFGSFPSPRHHPARRVRPHHRRRRRALGRRPRDLRARSDLPLHHHRRRGPSGRAGPAHPDRVRQPGAESTPAPAQLGPGRGHDAGRRGPCGHRGRPPGSGRAVRRRARPGRRRAWSGLSGQQRAPGAPLPHHGAPGGQPHGNVLHARPDWCRQHRADDDVARRRGGGDRGPGPARTSQAGDDRQRAPHRQRRPARRAFARLRRRSPSRANPICDSSRRWPG